MGATDWRVTCGDSLDVLKLYPDACFDSMISDPPAGIGFMGKAWDGDKGGRDQWIAWLAAIMTEAFRTLKPGAHCLVWALPRTSSWTCRALEDAGFEVRDILTHLQGSGFPKNHDISLNIDKAAGAEREVVGENPNHRAISGVNYEGVYAGGNTGAPNITAPATDAAKQWEGWGTAIKPSAEFWVLCRKPLDGTIVANVLAHGTGGINIDGCRVATDWSDRPDSWKRSGHTAKPGADKIAAPPGIGIECHDLGRWPANTLLSHVQIDISCASDSALAHAAAHAMNDSSAADSLSDCPSCLRSCGALLRTLVRGALDGQPSPADVHEHAIRLAGSLSCNRSYQSLDLPNSSDSTRKNGHGNTDRSKTSGENQPAGSAGSRRRNARRSRPQPEQSAICDSKDSSKKASPVGMSGNQNGKTCTDAASRLLFLAAGALVSGAWGMHNTQCAVAEMDRQSGERPGMSGGGEGGRDLSMFGVGGITKPETVRADSGGASRFFNTFRPDPFPFKYLAKPSSAERDRGLDSFATLSGGEATGRKDDSAGTKNPRAGAGRLGGRKNSHPTTKGHELMRWLCKLITPPGGQVLDPFAGSGTTGIACALEGFGFHGIELDPYHVDIARARIAYIAGGTWEPMTEKATAEKPSQGSLF